MDEITGASPPEQRVRSATQTIRRAELRRLVPLADTTIWELEQRGEFPRRFYLTPRCVVWTLSEVEEWIRQRKLADAEALRPLAGPDVRLRRTRPVRSAR
jgi:prophage regulatory protein